MRKYPLSLLKDKNIVTFFDFWGKTRRGEKDGGDDYHLLCWHSLDVAAMGYLMVKRNCFGLADYFRQLGISDKEQAAQFFAWLLCWHDIGKFARSFQQLYLPPELKIQESARKNYEKISHSTLGYWLWNHYLSECQELLPSSSLSPRKLRRVIEMWMPVTTGHHGRPPDRMDELDNFLPEDKAAARDFLLEIKPLFPLIEIPAFWDDDEGIELIKHLSWYISATVVLADWTGSSTRFFPRVAHPMDIKGYWQKTLIQAQNALTVFPLKAKVAPFNGINTLFPFIENPTPLQQKVLDLDISQQGPQLFILEDVTGAGKTEAALILAHRLIAAGKAQGLFFGLPTMATANAMYDRLVKTWLAFYSPESRPSLVLAHSARTLMDRFNESLWSGDLVGSEEPDEQTFSQGCAAWFADSNKKALLAEIGVGTLDQAMMAVMPFKHNNLRLLGLSNKILLADEIHACDAYMSCILEGLIERQARGGNSVILLSATLSQQQRDKLVAAFARGTEGQQEAPFLEKDDYPWLTHVTKSDVNSHRVKRDGKDERSPPELLILAPVWDDSPGDEWFGSAMRNSAFVYPDHGRIWLTQRVLREQGAIQMPHAARLLIESVYGEDVVMPEGFARSEQEQVGKYYCDRAMAKKFVLNFRPGYAANINDYLPEKLSTRLAEESVSLWLATCIDGVVKPYATGAHAWEMSVVRVRRSWWKKHRDEFSLLEGEAFRLWCIEQRQDPEMANVILVNDDESCGYSATEGLIGKVG
ncbi:CRISPR-associated helicase Cas3' [Escherichia coli]|nr:CRISPR-associated helicase Cas3' [Escherichia coli]